MLYFDNASTTSVYPLVAAEIYNSMIENWGNPSNLYKKGLKSQNAINEARKKIAFAIGASPEEIIFTSCSSESNAIAINQRKNCICSPYEHHDIKENNRVLCVDEKYIDTADFSSVSYKDYLYAHMLVNNETGEIFELEDKIKKAHSLNMLVLVDATQALGNIPIDAHSLNADFMSFSFHKVHGPKGIGVLYVKKEILKQGIIPLIYGSQEFKVRGGTQNVPYITGAAMAVEMALSEMEAKNKHCNELRQIIISELLKTKIPFIINEGVNNISSIISLSFKGITGEALMLALDDHGISVSTGSACNTGDFKPSEVLSYMKVPPEYINGTIRISTSLKNSIDEARFLVKKITESYYNLIN